MSNETRAPRKTVVDEHGSSGGMIIENVDDVSLEDFDRNSVDLEQNSFVKAKLKKIVTSVIGKNKKEDPKIRKARKEDNKKCYSKPELLEICENYYELMD